MRPFFQSAAMKDSAGDRGLRRDVGAARGDCLLGGPPGEAPRGHPSGRGLPAGSLSPSSRRPSGRVPTAQAPLRATTTQAVEPTRRQDTSLNQVPRMRRISASE